MRKIESVQSGWREGVSRSAVSRGGHEIIFMLSTVRGRAAAPPPVVFPHRCVRPQPVAAAIAALRLPTHDTSCRSRSVDPGASQWRACPPFAPTCRVQSDILLVGHPLTQPFRVCLFHLGRSTQMQLKGYATPMECTRAVRTSLCLAFLPLTSCLRHSLCPAFLLPPWLRRRLPLRPSRL